jgi:hypothetical protein
MNDGMAYLVVGAASLVSFICYIVVLIQMFQRGATAMAITCLVLTLCCGLGGLITFVCGWVKAAEWKIVNLMTVWTVAFAITVVAGTVNPAPYRQVQQMLRFER